MKPRTIALALVIACGLFSQDRLSLAFTAFRVASGIRVEGTVNGQDLTGTASNIQRDKSARVVVLRGNVDMTVNGIRLRADEVVMHEDTGEIEPSGNVHLTTAK
jgi:lipopolysaccharide assembly outer membrane protein LptD (OstA)